MTQKNDNEKTEIGSDKQETLAGMLKINIECNLYLDRIDREYEIEYNACRIGYCIVLIEVIKIRSFGYMNF